MIKLFRNIRQNLLNEGKTSKYFKYAIGEILLVVIGILIALQINNWNETQKKIKIKQSYIDNLITDLTEDTIFFKKNLILNYAYKQNIDSSLNFINNATPNLDTIVMHVKSNNSNDGLRVINNYNDNTFSILISSGNIDLFSNKFTNELMELNRLQKSENAATDGNRSFFFETLNVYQSKYYNGVSLNNEFLNTVLWKHKNPNDLIALYINMKEQQLHTINRYIELTTIVLKKTETILEQLKNNDEL
uniref:hypothetical protein n=1 Tax=Gelidibacter sp. TaxID=2018083 RepID=UPI00404B0E66